MLNGELSEYERQRLENIRQNQEILKALNIKGIIAEEQKKTPVSDAKRRRTVPKTSDAPEVSEAPQPLRQSSRLRNKATGMSALDEDYVSVSSFMASRSAASDAAPKPKRIVGRIAFNPEEGATAGFLESTEVLDYSSSSQFSYKSCSREEDKDSVSQLCDRLEIQNELSVVKVMRERIYSLAIHPDPTRLLICAGGKFGQLAFLDATEGSHPVDLANRALPDPEDFKPRIYQFTPHTGSISNLRYNPVNSAQLFTTAYDNIARVMDLHTGSFDELFNFGEDASEVITGFDVNSRADVFYFSDTAGTFKFVDRRASKESVVEEFSLHEKKIGSVSVDASERFLATASNVGAVSIWDLRKLSKTAPEPLHTLSFRRAVTSAYFHPTDASKIVSTCYDDYVRIHYNPCQSPSEHRHIELAHNNQTGRWITNFKAVWDPKTALAVVGNMNRGIDLIDSNSEQLARNITSEWLTAQPAVNALHPHLDVVASGNASGKIAVWTAPM